MPGFVISGKLPILALTNNIFSQNCNIMALHEQVLLNNELIELDTEISRLRQLVKVLPQTKISIIIESQNNTELVLAMMDNLQVVPGMVHTVKYAIDTAIDVMLKRKKIVLEQLKKFQN